jgi:hypothetical protein
MEDKTLLATMEKIQALRAKIEPDYSPNPNEALLNLVTIEVDNLKARLQTLDIMVEADPPNTYMHGHLAGRLAATQENLEFLQRLQELL